MSEIIVGNKHTPFSWLPNYLVNDAAVSAEALAAALYLHGKPDGWRARPFDLRKRFGWGESKWEKISKELKDLNLLHKKITKDGTQLWFELGRIEIEKPTREIHGPQKADPGKPRVLETKTPTKKDVLTNHDHDVLKKDLEPDYLNRKPPIKIRIANLEFDERCIYDKLVSFKGIFPGTAIRIVEANTIGRINNIIEMAFRDGITNPVGYIIESLYNQQGRQAGEQKENKT